ncbi:MAG TPA: aminotransferase class I/II-fold pyridoxal phosphate-dependent enzyme, partial [Firmicutes bacterium]|nr:aminotransferase class I/II-fold pyridoxal phosphate-dependent enzyme [Bacillota bacterium]
MGVLWNNLFSDRAKQMKASSIREFFKLTEQPDVISFAGGFPSHEYFPSENLMVQLEKVVARDARASLQYGPTEGQGELRRYLAAKMTREGIALSDEDNILITNGSQQGLDLLSKVLLNPGDLVIVEEPGYVGGLGAINNYQGSFLPVPVDQDGLRTDILEKRLSELRR